jgi:hypothetical protein
MEWIKTSEKLPDRNGWVIAVTLRSPSNARWYYEVRGTFYSKGIGWCEGPYTIITPDYWMPMPEPPELTEEEKEASERAHQNNLDRQLKKLEDEIERLKSCR